MPDNIDLTFLARQNAEIVSEQHSIRDDMRVLTAIMLRQDGTLTALLNEVRAIHQQMARMGDRIRQKEESA